MGLLVDGTVVVDLMAIGVLTAVAIGISYWRLASKFVYWKQKGVHFLRPEPFFGNTRNTILMRNAVGESLLDLYNDLEGHEFGGYYAASRPVLMVRDLQLIQRICVKDFAHFHDRGYPVNEKADPLSAHLFNLAGSRWRNLRVKLTPTFTSMRMKAMFDCIADCGDQLVRHLHHAARLGETLEVKDIMARYTTDVIGTCAFGLKLNSMENPNSEFRLMGRKLFEAPSLSVKMKWWALLFLPTLSKYLNVSLASKESRSFFLGAVKETVEFRRKNGVVRDDFMQLLIQIQDKGKLDDDAAAAAAAAAAADAAAEKEQPADIEALLQGAHEEFTDNMLAAQAFVFFVAGFETTSTTMSFCLHELAVNPDIQARVQEELDSVCRGHNGHVSYEAVQSLTYLDKVVAETLRKYPPIPNLSRCCTKAYRIPGTPVTLDPGTRVVVPVYAVHHDPRLYPDPERFDPERFDEQNKSQRHRCAYMPFGEGPRMCIGMRFAALQTKVGLAKLLADFTVGVGTRTRVPLKLDATAAVTSAKDGIWLTIKERAASPS